jgi:hypothetical protein
MGTLTKACNPSYSGGGHWEDYSVRSARAKMFTRLHLSPWLGVVMCACHPKYVGKHRYED